MIKTLEIKNYKSLEDVKIDLRPFTVFVGPNNAGKSNILDCLKFLSELVKEGAPAVASRGGFQCIVWGGDFHRSISVNLRANIGKDKEEVITYQIGLAGGPTHYTVSEEYLDYDLPSKKIRIMEPQRFERQVVFRDIDERQTIYSGFSVPDTSPILQLAHSGPAMVFRNYIIRWAFFNFVPSHMQKLEPVKKELSLRLEGDNLSTVLHSLHSEHTIEFKEIEGLLKTAVPEIEELMTSLTEQGQTYVTLKEKGISLKIPAWSISDGTLRFLAHLTVLFSPSPPTLVCFEEPENHIHPGLHELLADILKSASKKTYVLVTTHSPYILDHLEPEDVIVVEKLEGKTQCKRVADKQGIKEALKSLGLGELWYSGHIGGIP